MATVDLRPMTLGEVLDRTFTLYRENFLLFVGIAALPALLMMVFNFGSSMLQHSSAPGTLPQLSSAGAIGGIILGGIGGLVLLLLTVGVAHAATVSAVSDLYLGQFTSIRDAYVRAKGSILIVIAIIVLTFLAVVAGPVLMIVIAVAMKGPMAALLIFVAMLLFIPGMYVACRLAVSVPVAIVEKESPVGAMGRSMALTKEFAGQVFLLLLLVGVLEWVVSALLQAPVMLFTISAAVAKQQPSLGVTVYSTLAAFVSQVLVGPIGTISASLMYFNLRVKKEGFDIQHLMNSLGGSAPRPLQL